MAAVDMLLFLEEETKEMKRQAENWQRK